LVSTPDILGLAKAYREDVEYLPNPFDHVLFYPRDRVNRDGSKRVLIAGSCDWDVKGTDKAIIALSHIKDIDVSIIQYGRDFEKTLKLAKRFKLHLNILPKVPHEYINEYYWGADIVIDRFNLGSLGMVSLEAIACGRPVIAYVSSAYKEYDLFPLWDIKESSDILSLLIKSEGFWKDLWEKERKYLVMHHDPVMVAYRLSKIYSDLLGE